MKRVLALCGLFLLILAGCSSGSNYNVSVETAPKYKGDTPYPFVIEVAEKGKPVEGLNITSTLEMAKMDHGSIEASFQDKGNGLFESSIALPMSGEWIANIVITKDGKSVEKVITFDVEED